MEEEMALVDRVLTELNQIVETDQNLHEFEIIPIMENNKNTSPLLYENNNIALEMWCVKYVITYTKSYLMRMRNNIKRNLLDDEVQKVKRSLLGAILIQPEVSTYWNMRKELLIRGYITLNYELYVTKLVLSRKNKCNEAFAQRRWIFQKVLSTFLNDESLYVLLNNELEVAKMTSLVTKNNYHAWTHRIWTLQNTKGLSKHSLNLILSSQYESSYNWLFVNVSEHSAFQYRQRLMYFLIQNREKMNNFFTSYEQFTIDHFQLNNGLNSLFLTKKRKLPESRFEDFKSLFSLLTYELFHTIKELNSSYPSHESIWYHRRFVIYTLFDEIFSLNNKNHIRINDNSLSESENIISKDSNELVSPDRIISEEKRLKLFKPELVDVESLVCFNEIIKYETETTRKLRSLNSDPVERELAERHEKWLQCVLQINLA